MYIPGEGKGSLVVAESDVVGDGISVVMSKRKIRIINTLS